jgi:Uncharacterized conserved protein
MKNLMDNLTLEDLKEEQKVLAEIIGLESYKAIVHHFGGNSIYIHKADTIIKELRDQEIKNKFNGSNFSTLAKEYNLSIRQVRNILEEAQVIIPGQISIMDVYE